MIYLNILWQALTGMIKLQGLWAGLVELWLNGTFMTGDWLKLYAMCDYVIVLTQRFNPIFSIAPLIENIFGLNKTRKKIRLAHLEFLFNDFICSSFKL